MFLDRIEVMSIEPCLADPGKIRLKARLSADVGELLPYLNAVLGTAIYVPDGPSLTLRQGGRIITLYPTRLTLAKATNTTDAYAALDWVRRTVNDVYARRSSLAPDPQGRRAPSVLDILRWLPRDRYNCRRCGERTCLAFAVGLVMGERALENCAPLLAPDNAELRQALESLGLS